MQTVRSYKQITNLVESKAQIAIGKATKRILEDFKKEFIDRIVYNSHGRNAFYKPTNEFRDAWEWTEISMKANMLVTELYYNPSGMSFNAERFIHGSSWSKPPDVRDNLMDILNKRGLSSSANLSVSRPAAYWDIFIWSLFRGGMLSKILNEELKAVGFTKRK